LRLPKSAAALEKSEGIAPGILNTVLQGVDWRPKRGVDKTALDARLMRGKGRIGALADQLVAGVLAHRRGRGADAGPSEHGTKGDDTTGSPIQLLSRPNTGFTPWCRVEHSRHNI
jgi:hypothetical protein